MGAAALVFSDPRYAALACAVFAGMSLPLLMLSGHVFLEPYVVAHVPPGTELGLSLVVALSALSALVLPMAAYRARMAASAGRGASGGALGSLVGAAAGACGCGPAGVALFAAFGASGAAVSAFLTNYEAPIRLASIAALAASYYATSRSISAGCRLGTRAQS